MNNSKTREQITQDWINKNKAAEQKQIKARSVDKLKELENSDKQVVNSLLSLTEKHGLPKVRELLNLLQNVES